MEWWIIGVLVVVVLVLVSIYRKSLSENRHLSNFTLLVLLDEGLHKHHRQGLIDYLQTVDAKDAFDLLIKATLAQDQLATKVASNSSLGVSALLWKIRGNSLPFHQKA
jgi:hypothetical protein